jgi:hypothetical protein
MVFHFGFWTLFLDLDDQSMRHTTAAVDSIARRFIQMTETKSMIVSPHPDDAEYGVAGTVARWV